MPFCRCFLLQQADRGRGLEGNAGADQMLIPYELVLTHTALKHTPMQVYGGERACAALGLPPAPAARHEYSSKEATLELVGDQQEAVDHIHTNGSGHTEVIVTNDAAGPLCFLALFDLPHPAAVSLMVMILLQHCLLLTLPFWLECHYRARSWKCNATESLTLLLFLCLQRRPPS